MGNPLRKGPDFRKPFDPETSGEAAAEIANQVLGWTVMVGKVPRREASLVIGEHLFYRALAIDRTVGAGNLPHPVQNATRIEVGGELKPVRRAQRHVRLRKRSGDSAGIRIGRPHDPYIKQFDLVRAATPTTLIGQRTPRLHMDDAAPDYSEPDRYVGTAGGGDASQARQNAASVMRDARRKFLDRASAAD